MPLASLLQYVIQAIEEYGHTESTLRYRTSFISLWREIRNFSILIRTRDAGHKVPPVPSNKESSQKTPLQNVSLSKLQYRTSHGDCHLPFLTNSFDIFSKSCLFYNVSFKCRCSRQCMWFVLKVSVLIFYLNVYWTHLKLQVISFKVWPLGSYTVVPFFPLIIAVLEAIFRKCV